MRLEMDNLALQSKSNLPLLSNQKRLWIMSQQDSTNPAYNLQLTYQFRGVIDYDLLNKSIEILFNRHSTVFSIFKQNDGVPYINIIPREVSLESIDFSALPEEIRKEKILSFAAEDSRKSFDIENGPLYRLYLLKEADESYFFHATIHHIIFDGWSRRLFVQELGTIYSSLKKGVSDNLDPIKFQSYDYAEIEMDLMTEEEESDLISFWKENLRDCPPELRLPLDYPRKTFSTGWGRRESFALSKECTSKLKELCNKESTSLFNVVLSVLGVLFQKYSGGNDICIGVPVSTRRVHPELDKIFGLFINTTVIRLKIDDDNKFTEYVNDTKDTVKKALSHSKLPFERVVNAINPERILGINPLFQVSLSWLNGLTIPIDIGEIKGDRVTLPEGISPFDITFYMWEDNDTIKGDLEYNVDIFKQDTILRIVDNLIHLADSVAFNPGQKVSDISALSKNELEKINKFNENNVPVTDCLAQNFFEIQAGIRSGKTAVISGDSSLTYGELDEHSNQLARHLLSLGVKGGDVVGIFLERSVEMLVSVLGIIKAGCCYLPLDPMFPDERLKYMFSDSGARVIISESSLKERAFQFSAASVVLMDNDKGEISRQSIMRPDLMVDPKATIYIIYTSGSTGKPKGVKVHHQAVVNLIESMSKKPGIMEDDILLAVVTLSFDMSVFELFVSLSQGATIVIAESKDMTDGSALINLIEQHNITVIQATPSFWNILISNGWKGKNDLKALCGGEALTYSLVHQILPKVGEFWNCYGPTETTVYSTNTKVTNEDAPILIGKPIRNTTIYILDKNHKVMPLGAIGEVCIGGMGVTKGYHNKPDLTSEKFIDLGGGQIIYKTGDLGRYLEDGNIELFGRIDNQIKIRGYRIEPGEIETLLTGMPHIMEAVVKVHSFDVNDERLIAFLNTESEFNLDSSEIKKYLSESLPPYMIPSFYQRYTAFPRLPNGKINKNALFYEASELEKGGEIDYNSLTITQQRLLIIWRQILKTQSIKVTDNFFNAGGNSLLGIRLNNKIREEFGITLTFRDLIANSSITLLSSFIDSQTVESEETIELMHLKNQYLPLTKNQKRLWLITKLQPGLPTYIIRLTFKLNGLMNQGVFEKSLKLLFERHHIVFSVIKEINGEPFCDIESIDVKLSLIDYTGVADEEKSGKVRNFLNEDSKRPFDLERGPLFRLYLIKVSEEEHYFHMSIHHIIFDGWSQGVLVNDLSSIYNSLISGKEIDLEPLEYQQYDYAQWEANATVNEASIAFWEDNLRDCSPVLNFPYDYQRSGHSTGSGRIEPIRLSKSLSDDLRKISREEGVSLFTTMMSGFGALMHKYSGEDDLNIGLPVAYRPHTKLEKVFGMFVNTVVVRLRYDKGVTFRELIKRTEEASMNAISHQDVSFDTVVETVKPERIPNTNPLFQVAFAWQNNLSAPMNLVGLKSERITNPERASIFDIIFYLWENGDIIEGEIEYNPDIIKPETITGLKKHFLVLLNNMISGVTIPLSTLSLISDEEKQMIDAINDTHTNYPKDKTIIQLFEEQVMLYPDKKAVVYKEESITYKQLNEKANQIARTLRASGVSNNIPVGILSEKSVDMVVGIIGILKAGGAYVPIDPEYPEQRINFIIEDSQCTILVLQNKFSKLPFPGVQKINLNSPGSYNRDRTNIEKVNSSSDLAYIMYTSGTTGKPKGSMIQQFSVVRLIRDTNYIALKPEDRLLLTGAIVFDATTFEIWGMLLNGGTLYIVDKETILDAKALGGELIKNDITVLWLTSALFTQIAASRTDIFGKLKYLLSGGDVLSAPHINKVRSDNPNLNVINGYGPTENTTFSLTYLINRDYDWNIPIGKPISNSTAYIFDDNMNYQPIGVIGKLYVGGDGLSTGYLNRDDLNKTRFIENPHNPEERLYNTGDLARWLPDGNIEFRGRVDNQLKIRGFRVELEEIELVISEIEGVIETVVKPLKVDEGDYRLVAFLNVSEDFHLETNEILRQVRIKLPSYMVPSAFKSMHGFPKTINGKTDKKALTIELRELESKAGIDRSEFSTTESKIHKIWCEALKTNEILLTDNFFDIGGNSLMAISVFSKIESEFNVELGLRIFFDSPRIIDLAEVIEVEQLKSGRGTSGSKKDKNNPKIITGEI